MAELFARLANAPIVPLVQAEDPSVAIATAKALAAGGLSVIELVLRTSNALDCLEALCAVDDNLIVGAGTVLSVEQAAACLDRGAQFLVSPGLDDDSVQLAKDRGVPIFPGVMTPTELMRARNFGLKVVKFFPASIVGGVPALRALGSVFGDTKFMPTGGVSAENLGEFLALPSVLACGGSWLTPAAAIVDGDYDEVTRLAREAVELAVTIRGSKDV